MDDWPGPAAGGLARPPAIAVILALYLALGIAYGVVNPLFEAPDEIWHYEFVRHLRTGQGLPVVRPGGATGSAGPEAAQPPLYYALAAALTWWIPSEDLVEIVEPNPSGSRGFPDSDGNKHAWITLRPDRFPWSGEFLAAHLARLLSVAIGALTVLATWRVARELAPSRPSAWLVAAALNAFLPQFLFISSAVSNDVLAACAASWGLLLVIRTARLGLVPRRTLLLGALAGLGALAKLSVLGLVPLALVGLTVGAWRHRSPLPAQHPAARWLGHAALLGGVVLATSGWWFARNLALYGDPLAFRAFIVAAGGTGQPQVNLLGVVADLPGLWLSFWALFGWFSIRVDSALYAGYTGLAGVALVGLGVWARRAWPRRGDRPALLAAAIAALWVGAIAVAFVGYSAYAVAGQGRLFFPAIAAICGLLGLGLAAVGEALSRRWATRGSVGLACVLALAAAAAPLRYIAPAYAPPPPLPEGLDALAAAQHRCFARFGEGLELLAYDLPRPNAGPGEDLDLALYWRATAALPRNYVVSVQALDSEGGHLAQSDSYPGRGNYPTRAWRPGEVFRDTYRLRLPATAAGPAAGQVVVSVYPPGGEPLPAFDGRGARIGLVAVARFRIAGPAELAPPGERVADLGGEVRLVAYDVSTRAIRPGDELRGELRWTALRPPGADYTAFVQLLGAGGPVAQYDSQPHQGRYPTTLWPVGELVRDAFAIPVGSGVEPGEYRLIAGLYELDSGRRLADEGSDFASLGTVRVAR